jgi:hypothetical protein
MTRIHLMFVSLITGVSAVLVPPTAWAEDNVTYEVISNSVAVANIEYFDRSERRVLNGATLPWRTDVTVVNVYSPSTEGAEVRADWRGSVPASPLPPGRPPGYWVTVRISFRGKVVCQNTLDVGDAACYGSTTFIS